MLLFVESDGEKYLNNIKYLFINYNNTYIHIYTNEYLYIFF